MRIRIRNPVQKNRITDPTNQIFRIFKRDYDADLQMVSRPERSVTWTKVSLKEAKMCATPNTSSPSRTWTLQSRRQKKAKD